MKETWCSQLSIMEAFDNQGWVPGLAILPDLSNSASRFLHVLFMSMSVRAVIVTQLLFAGW